MYEHSAPEPAAPRRRRWLFWPAVLLTLGAIGAGGYLAASAYAEATSARTVAEEFLAALVAGDAETLLAYGDHPDGDTHLLTDDVLAAQRAIAPMADAHIDAIDEGSGTATVAISYVLEFPDADVPVTDTFTLVRDDRTWRVARVAAERTIDVPTANDRVTFAGHEPPDGTYLMFPGALPLEFDTPNLGLPDDARVVVLTGDDAADEDPSLSEAGQTAIRASLEAKLTACLDGTAPEPTLCPLPSDFRAVPGSARGSIAGGLDDIHLALLSNEEGRVIIQGEVEIDGEYQTLDFNNQRVTKTDDVTLTVRGWCWVSDPETLSWTTP